MVPLKTQLSQQYISSEILFKFKRTSRKHIVCTYYIQMTQNYLRYKQQHYLINYRYKIIINNIIITINKTIYNYNITNNYN